MEPPEGIGSEPPAGSFPEALEAFGRVGDQPEMPGDRVSGQLLQNVVLYGVSLAIAVAALILAKRYRRIQLPLLRE